MINTTENAKACDSTYVTQLTQNATSRFCLQKLLDQAFHHSYHSVYTKKRKLTDDHE
jgi:hypothetical protein